jgi:hypothetical protein
MADLATNTGSLIGSLRTKVVKRSFWVTAARAGIRENVSMKGRPARISRSPFSV